jgi:hypothetical protein
MQYCSAAFFEISQAFDKVWHTGLLYKLRRSLPLNYFLILKSYLHNRHLLVKVETEYTKLSPVNADAHSRQCLGPLLYLLYTANLPTLPESTTANFSDDTAVITTDSDHAIASQNCKQTYLQSKTSLRNGEWMLSDANGSTSFRTRKETCPPVQINNVQLPQKEVKYFGLHLDRRLTWHIHIFVNKWKQLGITLTKLYWLLGRKSKLFTNANFSYTKQYTNQSVPTK